MKLTKAIETLLPMVIRNFNEPTTNEKQAIRLGIKAIERFRNLRNAGKDVGMPLLKGETEED